MTRSGKGHLKMWDWRHVLRNCKHTLHEENRQPGDAVQNANKKRDHLKLSQVLIQWYIPHDMLVIMICYYFIGHALPTRCALF